MTDHKAKERNIDNNATKKSSKLHERTNSFYNTSSQQKSFFRSARIIKSTIESVAKIIIFINDCFLENHPNKP